MDLTEKKLPSKKSLSTSFVWAKSCALWPEVGVPPWHCHAPNGQLMALKLAGVAGFLLELQLNLSSQTIDLSTHSCPSLETLNVTLRLTMCWHSWSVLLPCSWSYEELPSDPKFFCPYAGKDRLISDGQVLKPVGQLLPQSEVGRRLLEQLDISGETSWAQAPVTWLKFRVPARIEWTLSSLNQFQAWIKWQGPHRKKRALPSLTKLMGICVFC